MSVAVKSAPRLSVPAIAARKGGTPLVALTAYSAPVAALMDEYVDILLVGDSLGMVVYGMEDTLAVTMEMMINHGRAVAAAAAHACVVIDMPFGSYQESPAQAFRNAARILSETGAQAVKLEGGREMAETIDFMVMRGVPVMGHVGLMPQRSRALGGFRTQGRDAAAAAVLQDARAIAASGAFSLVLESVPEALAREVTAAVPVPVIGIGASPACDGQVLVGEDMLGLNERFRPKFVKQYATLAGEVREATRRFAEDVRARRFPGPEHCFDAKPATKPGRGDGAAS